VKIKEWLEDRIRKMNNLPDDFEITEEWRRQELDKINRNATEVFSDSIYSSEFIGKEIVSVPEGKERYKDIINGDNQEEKS
jgi:hypothetical protein